MRHDTITVLELSTEEASIDAAYADSSLERLDVEFLNETGRARETFYRDSALFFVVRREYRYDRPLSGRVVDSTVIRFNATRAIMNSATADSIAKRH